MRTLCLAAALLVGALNARSGSPPEAAPAPRPPVPVPIPLRAIDAPPEVQFRLVARQVQEMLLTESCPPRPELRRAVVLAAEIAEVRTFEAGLADPARFHWDVAREDIARRQAAGDIGCWSDEDPAFARRHVQMARDGVRFGLQELRSLALRLPPLPDGAATPPANAAAFREKAGALVEILDPMCTGQGSDAFLAPARAELAGLRQRLAGTPYALQLELGLADILYGRGVPECAPIARLPDEVATRNALLAVQRQVASIEALVPR
jgi:hypothetical protein